MIMAETPAERVRRRQHNEQLNYLKQFHDEAYLYTQQAISCEEVGDYSAATSLYERSLQLMNQALSINLDDCPPDVDTGSGKKTQDKLRRTKDTILERLQDLRKQSQNQSKKMPQSLPDAPPSYDELFGVPRNSSTDTTYPTKAKEVSYPTKELESVAQAQAQLCCPMSHYGIPSEAEEIFCIPEGVQIFSVQPNGYVTAPCYPSKMTIYRFHQADIQARQDDGTNPCPPAFLQVGEWVYPLVPGQTPILHSVNGAYMFPDISNQQQPGAAIGVILPSEVDKETRNILEHIFCELTVLKREKPPRPEICSISPVTQVEIPMEVEEEEKTVGEKISEGAEYLAKGLLYGAEKGSEYLKSGGNKVVQKMESSQHPVVVDPRVRTGIRVAKGVSGSAVKISGFLVHQIGKATLATGRYLAPHIREQGSNLLRKTMNTRQERADSIIDNGLEIASGGVRGFAVVYMGLEEAAKILASSLANETVHIVQHKYGDQAGASTDDALSALGNTAVAATNIRSLGVKGIAKRAAKNTGKALVEEYEEKKAAGTSKQQQQGAAPAPEGEDNAKNEKKRLQEQLEKKK